MEELLLNSVIVFSNCSLWGWRDQTQKHDFGWEAQSAIYRACIIEFYTWDLHRAGKTRFTALSMWNKVHSCLIIYYWIISHMNNFKPTFAPICIILLPIVNPIKLIFLKKSLNKEVRKQILTAKGSNCIDMLMFFTCSNTCISIISQVTCDFVFAGSWNFEIFKNIFIGDYWFCD